MMIQLTPGETLTVQLKGTDGEFTIDWNETTLRITADMADTQDREGVIYEEAFPLNFFNLSFEA